MTMINKKAFAVFLGLLISLGVNSAFSQDDGFENFDFDGVEEAEVFDASGSSDGFEDFDDIDFDDSEKAEASPSTTDEIKAEAQPEATEPPADPVVEMANPQDLEPLDTEPSEDIITEEPIKEEPLLEEFREEKPVSNDFFAEESPAQPMNAMPMGDEPDYALEAKLHDIYVNFHNQKTSEAEWQAIAAGRASERYTIQSGDNLWTISKTFFGDGNYWPKIWSLNSSITNPHLIRPGNSIRFLMGDESQPPAFTVTESDSEEESTTNETLPEEINLAANGVPEAPDIPPPSIKSRPVVRKLPPSFPQWQDTSAVGEYDDLGIDYGKRKITEIVDTMPLPAYIAETAPVSFGKVSEIEGGSNLASALQYIYVSMNSGQGQVGDNFMVIRNDGEIQSPHPSITGFLGYSIEIQGELQLVERVSSTNVLTNTETFRAIVTKIVNPVSLGSELVKGNIEYVKLDESGTRSQVVAQVIGGPFFNKRQVYGNESVAFLNRGSDSGLEVGEVLSIRENRSVRTPDTMVTENVRPIGWLKIVRTTPHFSTAVIIRAWSDVLSGDITGSGEFVSSVNQNLNVKSGQMDSSEDSAGGTFDSEFETE